jgi:hypothetical protein
MACNSAFFTSVVFPDRWNDLVTVNVDLDNLYSLLEINNRNFFNSCLKSLVYGSNWRKKYRSLNSVKKLVE